jgi:hypothetical protein
MTEEWRPVGGFPGYEVSDQGRMRSLPREIVARRPFSTFILPIPGRMMVPRITGGGPRVNMSPTGGRQVCVSVNRAVLDAFVGPDEGARPLHLNGDGLDCRLANLEWIALKRPPRVKAKKVYETAKTAAEILRQDMKEGAIMLTYGDSEEKVRDYFGFTPEQMVKVKAGAAEAKRRVLQRHQARTLEGARA